MHSMSMNTSSVNTSNSRLWAVARSILLSGIGSALLASCSNLGYSSDASSPEEDAYTSNPEALAAEFSFPQASCGEQATQPSGTWYVVYIDAANPDEVRRKYCRDAIGTVRDKTGAPTVQVASLTDYSKALKLATAVGGEVETTVGSQTSPSPASSTASPTSSPTAANASSGTAYLTAADPGSSINIRESASTSAPIELTGRTGDQIRIAEQQQGDDGRTWYKVSVQSGQEGWVRSDFVTREAASNPGSNPGSTGTPSSFNSGSMANNSAGATAAGSQPSASPANSNGSSSSGGASPSGSTASTTIDRPASPDSTSSASASGQYAVNPSNSSDSYAASDRASEQYVSDETEDSSEESSVAPGSAATLVSDNPSSRINIRDDASTAAPIQHIGYGGDPVQVIDAAQGEDGYTWYQVEFDSGAVGWVRGDLVGGE